MCVFVCIIIAYRINKMHSTYSTFVFGKHQITRILHLWNACGSYVDRVLILIVYVFQCAQLLLYMGFGSYACIPCGLYVDSKYTYDMPSFCNYCVLKFMYGSLVDPMFSFSRLCLMCIASVYAFQCAQLMQLFFVTFEVCYVCVDLMFQVFALSSCVYCGSHARYQLILGHSVCPALTIILHCIFCVDHTHGFHVLSVCVILWISCGFHVLSVI